MHFFVYLKQTQQTPINSNITSILQFSAQQYKCNITSVIRNSYIVGNYNIDVMLLLVDVY